MSKCRFRLRDIIGLFVFVFFVVYIHNPFLALLFLFLLISSSTFYIYYEYCSSSSSSSYSFIFLLLLCPSRFLIPFFHVYLPSWFTNLLSLKFHFVHAIVFLFFNFFFFAVLIIFQISLLSPFSSFTFTIHLYGRVYFTPSAFHLLHL